MTLRTQVDPYVLVGDLADLPSPAGMPQGTLFHAEDTGDCRIIVINPLSGVRYWDLFCGTSGASAATSDTFFLKFSATVQQGSEVAPQGIYLADDMTNNAYVAQIGYSFPEAASVGQMFIDVPINAAGTLPVPVQLFKNNVPIVTFNVPAGATGKFTSAAGPAVPFAAGDLLDIVVPNPPGSGGPILLSVMVPVTII